jgi:vacuolar-type H+-ATPase subunit I/STV1
MSFEPRMRGRRFGRPAPKKSSAKQKREQQQSSIVYQETKHVNPSEVRLNILNSLEHLGEQRFALPPFAAHFERWIKDVKALLEEFETQLPDAIDEQYRKQVQDSLSNIQTALNQRIDEEQNLSSQMTDTQNQVVAYEQELAKLDRDHKTRIREVRRQYERSFDKLSQEIEVLDRQRLRIINAKPTLLQRLFRRSESRLDDKTDTLRSKKDSLEGSRQALKQQLEKQRVEYENQRKLLVEKQEAIRTKLSEQKGSKLDDALDLRKAACQELHGAVNAVMEKFLQAQNSNQ